MNKKWVADGNFEKVEVNHAYSKLTASLKNDVEEIVAKVDDPKKYVMEHPELRDMLA